MPAFYVALTSSRAHVSTTTSQEWITSFLTDPLNLWKIICLRKIHQSAQCWCEKKNKRTKRNCKCPYIVPRPIWILVANLMHLLNTYQRLFLSSFFFFFIFLSFFLGKWKAKLLFWKVKIICHAQLTFISWKAPITL